MKGRRTWIIRAAALLLVVLIAGAMFVIGRGHTVYFDNKEAEYEGKTYESFYKVRVIVDGAEAAKLSKGDRGMADLMGQTLRMVIEITDEEGSEPHAHRVTMGVPYGMDGIIINLPELMAGLPEDAYLGEFIIEPPAEEAEEEIVTDELEQIGEEGAE
ncbi:MAG: hypothetical protein IJJ38_09650 [Lachnospiraceae bacterium]|nr:hypothetical protein [Lachnospiraceae bacterium]